MNLEELRSVQSTERQKDSLQNLRPSFYEEVGEYIAALEAERDEVADRTTDPFASPEVARLTDEIETAKDVVEAIYERRMGKLVKQASLAAAGMAADAEGLTAEEQALFDDLVERIEANKHRVLDVLDGRADPQPATGDRERTELTPPPDEPPRSAQTSGESEPTSAEEISAADVMGGESVPEHDGEQTPEPNRQPDETPDRNAPAEHSEASGAAGAESEGMNEPDDRIAGTSTVDVDRLTVQITTDVGSILGVDDREYTLERDDVVTLPAANATPLIERDAAERLE